MCGQYKVNSTQGCILSISIDLGCEVPEVFLKFLLDTCPFFGPLIPLFWTSGDVSSGF